MSFSLQRSVLRSALQGASRSASSSAATGLRFASTKTLTEAVAEVVPEKQEQLKQLKSQYADASLGDIKVSNLLGGMRGLKVMLWEGSVLDAETGITFHGKSIPDCEKELPTAKDLGQDGKEMVPEAMLWLLLTGKVPSVAETKQLSQELAAKGKLPAYVEKIIDSFPKTLHPMTQFSAAVAALNHDSAFAAGYTKGMKKTEYWQPTLEDSISLIAKLPALAARIYYNVFGRGDGNQSIDQSKDWIGNYSQMIGYGDSQGMTDYLRLYIAIHGDHEGGNASAHTGHLVASTLADPMLSYSAALAALAGPLHGLANQEVLGWNLAVQKEVGDNATHQQIIDYLWTTLKSGRVVPGYGHAVLRKPDPRFMALSRFCDQREELQKSPIVQLVKKVFEVAPDVLKEHGKTKNPFPNVDAQSGCVLYEYGMQEFRYYTVVFGISRALGVLPQLVWDRALGMPIERPKSMSIQALNDLLKK